MSPDPVAGRRRVVVKFRPQVHLPYDDTAADHLLANAGHSWADLVQQFPNITFRPYFVTLSVAKLQELSQVPPPFDAPPFAFLSYFAIICPPTVSARAVAETVGAWESVLTAYVESGPTDPPTVNPDDDPRSYRQEYLNAAPVGIDARWAWGDVNGTGVGFVDLERGWKFNHHDLPAIGGTIWGENRDWTDHGTNVLGVVVARDNDKLGIGIAPNATARVVSQWLPGDPYFIYTAEAILNAVLAMTAGDVLLLEAQVEWPTPTGTRMFPVEVEDAVFTAILAAHANGIIVVEAAGNGEYDLDTYKLAGKFIFKRGHKDFRESGAILVGSAHSARALIPRARMAHSNFGSRVDCFAWGEDVDTTADDGSAMGTYTTNFTGTSSASAIVAGAAVLLQSWSVKAGLSPYSPSEVRARLSDPMPGVNTWSDDPAADKIGVMPNLHGIRTRPTLGESLIRQKWQEVERFLLRPLWDRDRAKKLNLRDAFFEHLPPEKRDVLLALFLTELAPLLDDEASRKDLAKAANAILKRATKEVTGR